MSLSDISEIIKIIGTVVTTGAACVGAYVAYRGLEKWRSETTGKRRAELAAAVLADFYEFDEIIRNARNPWVMPHETAEMENIRPEVATNSSFAPERRLIAHEEFFGRFRSRKHEFAAQFGRDSAKPFEEIWSIRREINVAVDFMLNNKRDDGDDNDRKFWREQYDIAFRSTDEAKDALIARLTTILASIETICRPAIDARSKRS